MENCISNMNASLEKCNHKTLSSLPDELLMKIVGLLPPSDLSAMMLVDKKFNNLSSDPSLWKRYSIPAMEIAQMHGLDILLKVLKLHKFSKVEVLDLNRVLPIAFKKNYKIYYKYNNEVEQKFLKIMEMANTLPLKSLDLSYNDLDLSYNTLPGSHYQEFLAKMVLNIQHVEFFATFRSKLQRASFQIPDKILDGVSATSVLRSINLGGCELDNLSVSRIVKLNCLSEVSMEGASMREEQARFLMIEMGKGSNIKKFDIGSESIIDAVNFGDVLESVEPEIVAKALNNVEYLIYNKINFDGEDCCDMEPDTHLAVFLEEMGDKPSRLKKIDMEENNYYHVAAIVVAKAFNKLEYLELKPNPATTTQQIVAILQLMAKQTNIVSLKFIYEDILWLNPGLVARAVVQVEQVDMLCKMSRAHIRAVLGQLDNKSRTRRLSLGTNDVSKIPGKIVENAVEILNKNGGSVVISQTKGRKYLGYSPLHARH